MGLSVADIVLIASTLFLAAVAIFGPAYAESFKAWLLRPVLDVEFRQTAPDCHLAKAILALSPSQKSWASLYVYRLRVTNRGKTQARKCEVVIEGLATADDTGAFQSYSKYTPVGLNWGSGSEDFVDINPDRHFFCDLLTIPNAPYQRVQRDMYGAYVDPEYSPAFDLGVILTVRAAFLSQPNRLPPGKHRIDIAVYSENADKVTKRLYVTWSGVWRMVENEMFRECVVSDVET